jgi:hypothetical protein
VVEGFEARYKVTRGRWHRDGKNTSFWSDPWIDRVTLQHHFVRPFELAAEKEISVADMIGEVKLAEAAVLLGGGDVGSL